MKPAPLVLVTDAWDPRLGGRERYLHLLAERAQRAGRAVRVVCRRAVATTGVEIRVVSSPRWPAWLAERAFVAQARRQAAGGSAVLAARPLPGATHVQLHGGLLADAFEAEAEAAGATGPLVRLGTRVNARRRTLLDLERRTLQANPSPRVMTWTLALAQRVQERFGLNPDALTVTPPGIDETVFTPSDCPASSGPVVELLFVAHNFALKGLARLLAALPIARAQGIEARLTVVGGGDVPRFTRLARDHGVAGQVTFAGVLEPAAVAEACRRADALVHPTYFDPCSLATLEALACGCPVVTTRANGASEWIRDGVDGLVVDGEPAALAQALVALLPAERRAALREEAARAGRRFAFDDHARLVLRWLDGVPATAVA